MPSPIAQSNSPWKHFWSVRLRSRNTKPSDPPPEAAGPNFQQLGSCQNEYGRESGWQGKGHNHLFGKGFCQKLSPLQLNAGRVSIVQSPFTVTRHDSRISSSCPTIARDVGGEVARVNFSRNVL